MTNNIRLSNVIGDLIGVSSVLVNESYNYIVWDYNTTLIEMLNNGYGHLVKQTPMINHWIDVDGMETQQNDIFKGGIPLALVLVI